MSGHWRGTNDDILDPLPYVPQLLWGKPPIHTKRNVVVGTSKSYRTDNDNADDFDNFLVDNHKVVLLTTHLKTLQS